MLNGYDFMIAFIKLGGIRKDREALLVREKQEMFLRKQKDEEDRKKLEADKKMELAADFDFTEEAKKMALYKVSIAATKFDPKHPSSPSLDCFNSSTMKAVRLFDYYGSYLPYLTDHALFVGRVARNVETNFQFEVG